MLNTILETLSQARTNFGGLIRESDAIILQSQVGEKLLGDLKVDMRNIMASTESMLGTANSADYAQNKVQYWEYILDAAKASLFCKDAVGGVQAILMKMSDDGDEEVMESQSIRQKIGEITDAMRKWQ